MCSRGICPWAHNARAGCGCCPQWMPCGPAGPPPRPAHLPLQDPSGASFPPYIGVLPIVLSWFVSPLLTAAASAFLFVVLRTLVLRRANSQIKALWVLPAAVWLTTFINVYFILTSGWGARIGSGFAEMWLLGFGVVLLVSRGGAAHSCLAHHAAK